MAVETHQITREGKQYTITIGTNAAANSELTITPADVDAETGNAIRYELKQLLIPFGPLSEVAYIKTVWRRLLIGPTGNVVMQGKEFTIEPNMISNSQDQAEFVMGLGMPILRSMVNGFVRCIMGFNDLRVFHPATGAFLEANYTPEQQNSPPTNDYHGPAPTQPPTDPA